MEDITLSGFGDLLKAYRKHRKISQQALATLLDVHRNTIGSWERGDFLPESKTMVLELAKQLHLDENETRRLLEASLTAITPYWNVPYQRNPFFTGRDELLHTLHEQLRVKQAVALCQSYALSGLGGIGKTQLALEYAYQYALEYRAIFWVAAETVDTLFSSFASIAELMKLPEREEKDYQKLVKAVLRWFTAHDEWLLIFDNVEDTSILKPFLPASRQGAILITTRLRALDGLALAFELLPFPTEEGIRFLLYRSRLIGSNQSMEDLSSDQMKTAQSLVEMMGGLPLALDQAGAYIERTGCGLDDYLLVYQQQQVHLLSDRSRVDDHPYSVVKTFLLSFEQMSQTNPAAADLLRVCAFLAPDAIPEELFTQGAVHLGPILSSVAINVHLFNQTLGEVLRYSLLQRNSRTRSLSLHRLLQVVLKATMDDTAYIQWATFTIKAIAVCSCLIEDEQIWSHYVRYFSHAQIAVHFIEQLCMVSSEAAQILYQIGRYFHDHAQYEKAEEMYLHCLHIREQVFEPEHHDVALILNGLGLLYWQWGKYKKAEEMYLRCLHIREHALEPEYYDIAMSLNGLGLIYWQWGKYEQAELFYNRVLRITEQEFGLDHIRSAIPLSNLGGMYYEQRKYEKAELFSQRALQIWEREFGSSHPRVATALGNLGELYYVQGKYEQAELFYLRALDIQEQTLGSENPLLAYSLNGLANIYVSQGQYEQAEPFLQRALYIREQVLAPDNPNIAISLTSFAGFYKAQGIYEQAEVFFLRALHIWQQSLMLEHPEGIEAMNDLVQLYLLQGKNEQAELLLSHALHLREETLGIDHPITVMLQQKLDELRQNNMLKSGVD